MPGSEGAPALPGPPAGADLVVVLAGGSALGAYHMGGSAVLAEAGWTPGWWVGTSIGAVTAAILLGNPPETREAQLRRFWDDVAQPAMSLVRALSPDGRGRVSNDYGLAALLGGRPGVFGGRWPGLWSILPFMPSDVALHDHRPLGRTLRRLIDFDRLNGGAARLSVVAVDVTTGEDVWFDTSTTRIGPEHLLAATALVPLFAPVTVEGRTLCDAGLSNNLALDRVLGADLAGPTVCIAADLFRQAQGVPQTLDEAVARVQDLAFGIQTAKSLEACLRLRDLKRRLDPGLPPVTLGQVAYDAPAHEGALKALDFSRTAIEDRAACGRRDMTALLHRLAAAPAEAGATTVIQAFDTAEAAPLPATGTGG